MFKKKENKWDVETYISNAVVFSNNFAVLKGDYCPGGYEISDDELLDFLERMDFMGYIPVSSIGERLVFKKR